MVKKMKAAIKRNVIVTAQKRHTRVSRIGTSPSFSMFCENKQQKQMYRLIKSR